MKRLLCGADPGAKGGFGFIDSESLIADAILFKTDGKDLDVDWVRKYLYTRIQNYDIVVMTLERVQGSPKFGGSPAFTFGKNYGMLKAILELMQIDHGVRLLHPTPQLWKKVVLSHTKKDKEAAITFVQNMYPMCNLVSEGCRVASDDLAEAVCMAHYGLVTVGNK